MTSNPSAKKLLRERSGERAKFNEALNILSQIDKDQTPATDRALAIQGSAMVEHAVESTIRTHLRKDLDLTESARLFGFRENGPLASFGARALMGYALGE